VDFWVALSDVVVIVRRLVREGWVRYRVGRDGRLDDRDLLVESLSVWVSRSRDRLADFPGGIGRRNDPESFRPSTYWRFRTERCWTLVDL
jgi:hypothetical protein